ncbi:hypothetical protein TNCV_2003131 [Trichonephila clavipes]|nr:hypothetical protein TNCV_2003131 [Trichonephila clavipes]
MCHPRLSQCFATFISLRTGQRLIILPRPAEAGLNCPIVLSEEFNAVDDDTGCTALIMADKNILELGQSLKNIVDADSGHKNEMNNATPVPMSSTMRNNMNSMFSYLDEHYNGEMNNRMNDMNNL